MARERWRMTLGELAYACHVSPVTLDEWADAGALGPRFQERQDQGRWRHITREAAQKAIITSRVIAAGGSLESAVVSVFSHRVGDVTELIVSTGLDVKLVVSREGLP